MTKITIVVDNEANDNLSSEHGLSLLIEAYNQKILFDTAKSDIFLQNAAKLDINLDEISYIFLSHNHYDHTGGLAHLSPNKPIYAGSGILEKCYSKHDDNLLYDISMPENSIEVFKKSKVIELKSFSEISPNIYATGEIPLSFPTHNPKVFYKDKTLKAINDISDERSMLLANGILVTGCCHRGVINTIENCKKHCPKIPIKTLIGGLHLLHCNELELKDIAKYLNTLNLEKIILLHCTGEKAKEYLSQNLNCEVILGKAGNTFQQGLLPLT